jgi:hypothetical protein
VELLNGNGKGKEKAGIKIDPRSDLTEGIVNEEIGEEQLDHKRCFLNDLFNDSKNEEC